MVLGTALVAVKLLNTDIRTMAMTTQSNRFFAMSFTAATLSRLTGGEHVGGDYT